MSETMKAGRDLDALVAQRVMKRAVKAYETLKGADMREHFGELWIQVSDYPSQYAPLPRYSSDIAAAWQIVGRMDGEWTITGHEGIGWTARFYSSTGGIAAVVVGVFAEAPTAPHAICLAALRATDGGKLACALCGRKDGDCLTCTDAVGAK
jgi:hypothetical protein